MNLRGSNKSELNNDPINPNIGDSWILAIGQVGIPGQASGIMGLTYSKQEVDYLELKYKTIEGKIVSIELR